MDKATKKIYKPVFRGTKFYVCQYCQKLIPDEEHDSGCIYYAVVFDDDRSYTDIYVNR